MYLVKLNAITSTNTYLRQLSKKVETGNWTVVTADFQKNGRGLVQAKWESEKGKNLLCSILIKLKDFMITDNFYLNCAISVGIYRALSKYNIPFLKVKWPNDIMSASKKLGGILIENSLKNERIYQSIIGIGLNVNQEHFPTHLPKAISMKQIQGKTYDRDEILIDLVDAISKQIDLIDQNKFEELHIEYENILYKKGQVQMFEDNKQQKFMGKIVGVSKQGKLCVVLEDEQIKEFGFKEIKFV
jgi:BirA family biotin operon repressor/biotin-[acetyl-CoA-carboxylase] ligase